MGIVDAAVHPVVAKSDDINAYLAAPYRRERLNAPGGGTYIVPIDEHLPSAYPPGGGRPGSDPELMRRHVLEQANADFAILLPLTRGLVADSRFEAAIAAATNEWLAATWLGEHNELGRYKGSIRVCPRSPQHAVEEIERWADHPHFVQVAVPLESHVAYGEQVYFPIWRAAAERGLPVAVHADRAGGVLLPPTTQGYPRYFLEEYSQQPLYGMVQVCSLIAHGVFERLPSLMFVLADGGFDYAQTLTWRMDKEWRSSNSEVPWLTKPPRLYLQEQVRFVVQRGDGPENMESWQQFVSKQSLSERLMFGSNYPSWDYLAPDELSVGLDPELREKIMGGNARKLYQLADVPAGDAAAA